MSDPSPAAPPAGPPADPSVRTEASPARRLRSEPLLPEAGAGGAPLTAVIAVISFLAAIALAAFLVISAASSAWTDALRATFTVQIKGDDAEAVADHLAAARRLLDDTGGVLGYQVTEPEEAARLLEPWLGKGNVGAYLNVPALIEVSADAALRNDVRLFESRLAAVAPGATVDDHGAWRDRLAAAASSGKALAFGVFALIMSATCLIAIFAARAGLAANEKVVSLLHLVGATDQFIANEVQRRFVILALRGAFTGVAAALLALAASALAASGAAGRGDGYFLPDFALSGGLIASLLAVPIVVSLVTAISARLTVLSTLRRAY